MEDLTLKKSYELTDEGVWHVGSEGICKPFWTFDITNHKGDDIISGQFDTEEEAKDASEKILKAING